MFRTAAQSANFLTDKIRKRQLEFDEVRSEVKAEPLRWKECMVVVQKNLKIAISSLYVRKYFDRKSLKVAREMVNAIKEEFAEILRNVSWMDEKTRAKALTKLKKMKVQLGHPDELLDDAKIIECYKDVKINEQKLLESVLSMVVFDTHHNFNKLREAVS